MYNRVILMGRLTADPELKQTQNGIAMCRFNIAVDRPSKQGEEKKTDFISISCWRNTADFVSKYFAKGKLIHIEGKLQQNNYTDQNNVKHYGMEVIADNVAFCGDKSNSQNQQGGYAQQQGGYYQQNQQYAPPPQYQNPAPLQNGYYQQPQYQQTAPPMQYPQQTPPPPQPAPPAAYPQQGKPPDILGDFDMSEFEEILGDGEVPF